MISDAKIVKISKIDSFQIGGFKTQPKRLNQLLLLPPEKAAELK